jgi:hypothetical protein
MFVASLSSNNDDDATVTGDGLKIIVWRSGVLYTATRASTESTFGAPAEDPLMRPAGDWFGQSQEVDVPSISGDGLAIYAHFGGQGYDYIWSSTRASTSEAFSAPAQVAELADVVRTNPFISFDGQTLYFDQQGHLYWTRRNASAFGAPTPITALDSPAAPVRPVVSAGQLTLYFSSNRTDGTAKGGFDIWVSTRGSTSDDFATPKAVDELNTVDNEYPVWIADDGCEYMIRLVATPRSSHVMTARRPL